MDKEQLKKKHLNWLINKYYSDNPHAVGFDNDNAVSEVIPREDSLVISPDNIYIAHIYKQINTYENKGLTIITNGIQLGHVHYKENSHLFFTMYNQLYGAHRESICTIINEGDNGSTTNLEMNKFDKISSIDNSGKIIYEQNGQVKNFFDPLFEY